MTQRDDPDRPLVERFQAGDEMAFDEIMSRYKRPIWSFIYRMLNDAQEAEDVAQDVFVRVYQNARDFKPRALFSTWLFQIARNAALDRARKIGKFQWLELSEDKAPIVGTNPATNFQSLELSERIAAAVAQLPEDQRVALVLAEYDDRSHADIASIMKCSEKSVEGRLYRARDFLRRRLADLL